MRKSRFTERQIVVVLKQAEAGVPIQDLIRKYGICEQTFYRWKKKFGGLDASELQQLKQLRDENRRLKGLVADLTLDKQILQEVLAKKSLKAVRRREIIDWARERVSGVGSRGLLCASVPALELLLPEPARSAGSPSDASQRARRFTATIWLSPPASTATAGGLEGESQGESIASTARKTCRYAPGSAAR